MKFSERNPHIKGCFPRFAGANTTARIPLSCLLILTLVVLWAGCGSKSSYREASMQHYAYASGETPATLAEWHTLIAEFENIIRADDRSASADDAQYAIASCWVWCIKAGDTEAPQQAIEAFQKLIHVYPNSQYVPQAHYWLGRCYTHIGDATRGVQYYQIVTNRYADADVAEEAQLALGHAYAQKGYITRAETLYAALSESATKQEVAAAASQALQTLESQQEPVEPPKEAVSQPQSPIKPKAPIADAEALAPKSLTREFGLTAKTIVIDAGHGGEDPGALGAGNLMEKPIALSISEKLGRILTAKGYTVLLTRDTDRFIPLKERTEFAMRRKADLFLSIHANASKNQEANGIETYYLDVNNTDKTSETSIAERENANSGYSIQELETLLKGLIQESKSEDSHRLAKHVQQELVAATGAANRGVKHARFVVLIGTNVPAILIEAGFVSNPTEGKKLATAAYQQQIAGAIARGVEKFLADRTPITRADSDEIREQVSAARR